MFFFNILANNTILGTLGDNSIIGSGNLDYILGLTGKDTINGGMDNDILLGGNGDDALFGEAGLEILIGGNGADSLDGGDDDDTLHGGNDNDILYGQDGNDLLVGGSGDDELNGGDGDDTLQGSGDLENPQLLEVSSEIINLPSTNIHQVQSQIHQVFASIELILALHNGDSRLSNNEILNSNLGSDTLDGGAGYDTADYSNLDQAITVTPTGVVEKANGGTDQLVDVEHIIGAPGQDNKIDAIAAVGDSVYIDADLTKNRLTVKGIPGLGDLNFDVENFRHMSGTNQSDLMVGNSDNNILEGHGGDDSFLIGLGADTVNGGVGYDTVDYANLDQAVTITPAGIVEKANGEVDELVNVEHIIGALGQGNKIDAIAATGDSVYIDADLTENRLTVKGIPGLGDLNFDVENFRHMSGTNQSDLMVGNDDNNILKGHGGDDDFLIGLGADTVNGGVGYDTVDYANFEGAVTITPTGIVEKANGEIDQLVDVEHIIGTPGQENKIDAIAATGDSVYIDANLTENRLTIKGIPGLGDLNFDVENFRHMSGTNRADIMGGDSQDNIIEGHDGNDTIYAGLGNDRLDGGGWFDTVDYSNFGQAVTLKPRGIMEKANGENDLLVDVERIVGAAGESNKIDASSVPGDTVNLYVDLSLEQLIIKDIPVLGEQDFQVANFLHVSGTNQADTIIGNSSDNILEGNGGNDTLIGSTSNGNPNEIDVLTGDDGADSFVLGDSRQAYYQGNGFAQITDFDSNEGDQFIVFGSAGDYTISQFEGGTNITYQGDIIAIVTNTTDVDLSSDFVVV